MHRLLPALLLLAPALHAANDGVPDVNPRQRSAISMLPTGSQLHGVMFPRYDEDLNLIGSLKAKAMTLVNETTIAGERISVEFFNADGNPRGRVDLATAWLDQSKGLIQSSEPVTLRSDRITAKGDGLCYAFEQGQGFLLGPVTTWIEAPTETTMNSTHSPARATALLGMSLLALPVAAAPPPAVSPAEVAALQKDAEPPTKSFQLANQETRDKLRGDLDASDAATEAARSFLEKGDLAAKSGTTEPAIAPPSQPLDVTPDPDDTVVNSDNGMYFDADKGVFVFLKNVRVKDPRFTLDGANSLKIFLAQKPGEVATSEEADPDGGTGFGAKFGDVERVLATGAVHILQVATEEGKAPIEASGAIFSYHPETGEIILSGGYPWVVQGTTRLRAQQPNLSLRIQKNGNFITEGHWEAIGKLNQAR